MDGKSQMLLKTRHNQILFRRWIFEKMSTFGHQQIHRRIWGSLKCDRPPRTRTMAPPIGCTRQHQQQIMHATSHRRIGFLSNGILCPALQKKTHWPTPLKAILISLIVPVLGDVTTICYLNDLHCYELHVSLQSQPLTDKEKTNHSDRGSSCCSRMEHDSTTVTKTVWKAINFPLQSLF